MVTFHLLSSSLRVWLLVEGKYRQKSTVKSNSMVFEQAAWWYAQSERHKLRQIRLVLANSGAGKKKDMPMVY